MPFVAIAPAIGLVVGHALTITGAVIRCTVGSACKRDGFVHINTGRADVGLCNVPQYNFDLCQDELQHVVVDSSIPEPGVAQFDNIPASCMTLSTVLTDACGVDGPRPEPCGSACLRYLNLSEDDMRQISEALQPYGQ